MGASGEQHLGVFGAGSEQLREMAAGVSADVEDLLVDAHRELGVGVVEQVHRAARRNAKFCEQEAKVTPENVRDRVRPSLNRPAVAVDQATFSVRGV